MRTWPKGIQEAIGACRLEKRVMSGASTDLVYRIEAVGGRSFHLKVAGRGRRDQLRLERDVLNWLAGRLWAPTVETYCEEEQEAFLLMSSAPGLAAADLASDFRADAMLAEVARTLRQIHALPVQSCPFDRTLSVVVAEAYRNAADGQVELDDLDHERRGWSTDRLLDELNRGIPKAENCVFTHGDLCLPNVLLQGGRVSGIVDWGRAGTADPYQDIALLFRSFGASTDVALRDLFCEVYGIRELDMEKLRFYQLLDEFF